MHGRAGRTQTGREEISRSLALVVEVEVEQEVEEIGRGGRLWRVASQRQSLAPAWLEKGACIGRYSIRQSYAGTATNIVFTTCLRFVFDIDTRLNINVNVVVATSNLRGEVRFQ